MNEFGLLEADEFCCGLLSKGERIDGRSFDAGRGISIQVGVIRSAFASAMVKQGPTTVMAAIRAELCEASPSGEGQFAVTLDGRLGPTGGEQELYARTIRILNDVLSDDSVLRRADLCLAGGRIAWRLDCDLTVLSAERSNLLSSCMAACTAALKSVRLPSVVVCEPPAVVDLKTAEGIEVRADETVALAFSDVPVAVTFAFYADGGSKRSKVILDPSDKELQTLGEPLTIVVGRDGKLYGVFAFGVGKSSLSLKDDKLTHCIDVAISAQKPIERTIDTAVHAAAFK